MKISQLRRVLALALAGGVIMCDAVAQRGGGPVTGTDHEARCTAMIEAIVDGTELSSYLSTVLMVGPGFAHAVSGDQTKFPYGEAMLMQGFYGERQMFFLGYAVRAPQLPGMLQSSSMRNFLRSFKGGDAQPATRAEREIYYSLIAWEIAGQPVTVVRDGSQQLLIQNTEDGRLFWMDVLDPYPLPSVAPSLVDAIELISIINEGD